jgi:hypothetical protein
MDSVVSETRAAPRKSKANQKGASTNSNTAAAGRSSSPKANKANTDVQANKGSSKSKSSITTTSPRHSEVQQQQQKKQQTSSSKSDKAAADSINRSKSTGSGRTVINKSDMSSDDIGEYCIGVA